MQLLAKTENAKKMQKNTSCIFSPPLHKGTQEKLDKKEGLWLGLIGAISVEAKEWRLAAPALGDSVAARPSALPTTRVRISISGRCGPGPGHAICCCPCGHGFGETLVESMELVADTFYPASWPQARL